MKRASKIFSKLVLALALGLAPCAAAASRPDDGARIAELDSLNFAELLNSVELGKQAELVRSFQEKEGRNKLINGKYNPKAPGNRGVTVSTYRNKEVLVVSVPLRLLFGPNETELLPTAPQLLSPLRRYLKDPDMYRVAITVHTDNTGSEQYREELTIDRADAIFDWFDEAGTDTRYLFPFGMGDDMPLAENNTMEHRDLNRRLDIYLIPGKKMLEQAKKGRIVF